MMAGTNNSVGASLRAITQSGKEYNVTSVKVNDRDVSPPNSDDDDNNNDNLYDDVEMGGNGLERAYSGSTKTTDTSDSIDINNKASAAGEQQQQPPEDSNNSTQDSEDDGGGRRTPPSTMSRENSTGAAAAAGGGMGAGTSFEASLLLGIAGTESGVILPETPQPEKERREPIDSTTLPTSMTSFLDMLTEEQRRVRHRYIPGVEGFRKLYKGEIRADMSEARRTKRTTTTVSSREVSEESLADNAMEVDKNNEVKDFLGVPTTGEGGAGGGDNQSVASENAEEEEDDDNNGLPNREAFIAPTKESRKFALKGELASLLDNTDFENSVKSGGGGGGASSFKSPHLVDSLTSFNPPRPQESTTYKTHHRLKRWEANPAEVETDLMNYRKTVSRTRTELHLAQKEHERIERVSSLMRSHFMNHLVCYKQEMMALNDGIGSVNGKCSKLDDEYNGIKELRSMATRGGQSSRTMKDFVGTLKSLGEEIEGVKQEDVDVTNKDWRVTGVGGVTAKDKKAAMGNGWLLVGDEVIVRSTGEEGVVVLVCGPEVQNKVEEEALVEDKKAKQDGAAEAKNTGGDAMDVDDTPTKKEDEKKENKSPTKKESPKKKELSQVVVKPTSIKVNLAKSGKVETFLPTEIEFNPKSLPTLLLSDPKLAKRWENMVKTGLANSADHDVLAMEEYINSSLVQDKTEGDGATSPKCVGEERSLLPFGSGCVAAPEDVKNYPSVIPLDNLEETVRKVVYEAEKPRVMVTMSSNLRAVEARKEEINVLKGKALQLRNRLGRQKRLRSQNERSLVAGKHRAHKVETLLLEMQMDLKNLKGRLHKEVLDLGVGNGIMPAAAENGTNENAPEAATTLEDGATSLPASDNAATDQAVAPAADNGIGNELEPESKRARVE